VGRFRIRFKGVSLLCPHGGQYNFLPLPPSPSPLKPKKKENAGNIPVCSAQNFALEGKMDKSKEPYSLYIISVPVG